MCFISAYFLIFLTFILSEMQMGVDLLGLHGLHSASLVMTC